MFSHLNCGPEGATYDQRASLSLVISEQTRTRDCRVVLATYTAATAFFLKRSPFISFLLESKSFLLLSNCSSSQGKKFWWTLLSGRVHSSTLCSSNDAQGKDLGLVTQEDDGQQQPKQKQSGCQRLKQLTKRGQDYEDDKGAQKSAAKPRTGTCNVKWEQDKGGHCVAIWLPTHLEGVFIWTRNDTIVVLHYLHTLDF